MTILIICALCVLLLVATLIYGAALNISNAIKEYELSEAEQVGRLVGAINDVRRVFRSDDELRALLIREASRRTKSRKGRAK